MQTRPKLLHYGLSWPISGAFANPNCALAGRDCSIQEVLLGGKKGNKLKNSTPAVWAAIIHEIWISYVPKTLGNFFFHLEKLIFMVDFLFAEHINTSSDRSVRSADTRLTASAVKLLHHTQMWWVTDLLLQTGAGSETLVLCTSGFSCIVSLWLRREATSPRIHCGRLICHIR